MWWSIHEHRQIIHVHVTNERGMQAAPWQRDHTFCLFSFLPMKLNNWYIIHTIARRSGQQSQAMKIINMRETKGTDLWSKLLHTALLQKVTLHHDTITQLQKDITSPKRHCISKISFKQTMTSETMRRPSQSWQCLSDTLVQAACHHS
jgi:hypothetical protein